MIFKNVRSKCRWVPASRTTRSRLDIMIRSQNMKSILRLEHQNYHGLATSGETDRQEVFFPKISLYGQISAGNLWWKVFTASCSEVSTIKLSFDKVKNCCSYLGYFDFEETIFLLFIWRNNQSRVKIAFNFIWADEKLYSAISRRIPPI